MIVRLPPRPLMLTAPRLLRVLAVYMTARALISSNHQTKKTQSAVQPSISSPKTAQATENLNENKRKEKKKEKKTGRERERQRKKKRTCKSDLHTQVQASHERSSSPYRGEKKVYHVSVRYKHLGSRSRVVTCKGVLQLTWNQTLS